MRLPVLCSCACSVWAPVCVCGGSVFLCVGAYWEYKLSLATQLVGAEDTGLQQPLSGLSHLARCILPNSNLFKIQPLQFAAKTWQYFHSTELWSCQKADKKRKKKIWHSR